MFVEHFATSTTIPDLSKPSLINLVYLLRHKELWPSDFPNWDYTVSSACALGLAMKVWWPTHLIKNMELSRIFCYQPPDTPPTQIADLLDKYISQQ